MASKEGITWKGDLSGNIQTLGIRNKAAMVATAKYFAPKVEAYMRENAKWTDRTGNARNGLFAKPIISKNQVDIVLYHTMDYGIWLELRWSGKYAIINPTIQHMAPKYFALLAKAMFNKGSATSGETV